MSKIITLVGACSTKNRPLGMQFLIKDGECALSGSFTVGEGAVVSSDPLTGNPVMGENFMRVGCKLCGNKFAYQCGCCKRFICYDGRAKSNASCPSCGNVADIPAASGNKIARTGTFGSPYGKWASTSDIPAAPKDSHGNPQGSEYDLARDNSLKNYRVVIVSLYPFDFSEPEKALQRKGFTVKRYTCDNISQNVLASELAVPNTQLWVIANNYVCLTPEMVKMIVKFFQSGHGVYIWSDNDPFYVDTNIILKEMFGNVYMTGYYMGDKVLSVQRASGQPGIVPNHPITTGIVNFYEGITISNVVDPHNKLKPLIYSSDGLLAAKYYDSNGCRALVDGGFTRLYHKWDTAGTDRYVVNAAAWLANIERFGYKG